MTDRGTNGVKLAVVRVADFVVHQIARELGDVVPEEGGALLGAAGADLVTRFVHDAEADVTAVRYRNSSWLIDQVLRLEAVTAARLKGVVHSHPVGTPFPTAQDRKEYARSLERNPHLSSCLAPIVTHDVATPLSEHEMAVRQARISWFIASPAGPEDVRLVPAKPVVLPIVAALRRAGADPGGVDPMLVAVDGASLVAIDTEFDGLGTATVLFGDGFPALPPVVMLHNRAGSGAVALAWDPAVPAADRFAVAVRRLAADRPGRGGALRLVPDGASDRANGRYSDGLSHIGPACTGPSSGESALLADGIAVGSAGAAAAAAVEPAPVALFARSGGLLSPSLRDRRVLVVGAGSVGSYVAESLIRSGVGALALVDPDTIAPENLGRSSAYVHADIGRPKAWALADRLRAVNPALRVTVHQANVAELDGMALLPEIEAADLVVAATDDDAAHRRIGDLTAWTRTPAVFLGIHRGAAGGEVIMTYEGSACWRCSARGTRDLVAGAAPRRVTDDRTGRLAAEPGLLADVHHVVSAGVKVVLALLHDAGDEAALARFLDRPRERGTTYLAIGTMPDYWIFPYVLGPATGQHAFQSAWLSVDRDPRCPVCGPDHLRADPTGAQTRPVEARRVLPLHRDVGGPGGTDAAEPPDAVGWVAR